MGQIAKDLQAGESLNTSRTDLLCGFGQIFIKLDPEDKKGLSEALDNPKLQTIAIYRVLTNNDFKIGYDVLARHRRRAQGGGCRCPLDL